MQIVILVAIIVTTIALETRTELASPWAFTAALGVYVLGTAAIGLASTATGLRTLLGDEQRSRRLRRQQKLLGLLEPAWLIAGSAATVLLGYGAWAIDALEVGNLPLLPRLVALIPFFVALLVHWVLEYPYHRAVREALARQQRRAGRTVRRPWSLREYLAFNTRHHLLFILVPVGLILLLRDSLLLYVAPLLDGVPGASWIMLGGTVASAGLVFFFAPMIIVQVWKTRTLPADELREDLEETCRSLGLSYRDILIWRSGGILVNAGVVGVAGPVRYVLLSDALLDLLDREQIRAVFAHEAGHIVCHHIFYAATFAIGTVLLFGSLGDGLMALGAGKWWVNGVSFGGLILSWWLGFGWLSRRFERQSDVMAAHLSDPQPDGRITPRGAYAFATALEEVARLNGSSRTQRNWRHGSVAFRVNYLLQLAARGGNKSEINGLVQRVKLGLLLTGLVSIGLATAVYTAM
ncbi:MAG: M48 family metallopeptidase [Planctomycetota bacterium]